MQGDAAGRVRVAGASGCYWEGKSGWCEGLLLGG